MQIVAATHEVTESELIPSLIRLVQAQNKFSTSYEYFPAGLSSISVHKDQLPIKGLSVTTLYELQDVEISLESSKNLRSIPNPNLQTYKFLEIQTKNLHNDAITSATITFSVSKSWMRGRRSLPEDITLLHYTGIEWEELPTNFAREEEHEFIFDSQTSGFSVFAIATNPQDIDYIKIKAFTTAGQELKTASQAGDTITIDVEEAQELRLERKRNEALFWLLIISGVTGVLLGFYALFHMKKHKHAKSINEKMARDYIEKVSKMGFTEKRIRKYLIEHGYKESDVDDAFEDVKNSK